MLQAPNASCILICLHACSGVLRLVRRSISPSSFMNALPGRRAAHATLLDMSPLFGLSVTDPPFYPVLHHRPPFRIFLPRPPHHRFSPAISHPLRRQRPSQKRLTWFTV